jgi:hypothetical protein
MKREDLEKLGLSKEQIDSIMGLHGADIETHKTKLTEAESARDQFKTQLDAATQQIEGFKDMKKPEEVEAAISEWQTKLADAEKAANENLQKVKFDHALESALTGAKAKNIKAVSALLSTDALKLKEDGTIEGLDDQLKTVKEKNDYLFESETKPPVIVKGGNSKSVIGDPVMDAARRGAGLPETP